jgi:hypothetical protein
MAGKERFIPKHTPKKSHELQEKKSSANVETEIRKRTLRGRVGSVDEGSAIVHFFEGEATRPILTELMLIDRLKPVGADYDGARITYEIVDQGAKRVITIRADKEQVQKGEGHPIEVPPYK